MKHKADDISNIQQMMCVWGGNFTNNLPRLHHQSLDPFLVGCFCGTKYLSPQHTAPIIVKEEDGTRRAWKGSQKENLLPEEEARWGAAN